MLSLKQINDVCLVNGNYKRCRYLAQDEIDRSKWHCLKKTAQKIEIDEEIDDFLKDLKKKGLDPAKQGVPMGDNCSGYPIMNYIQQGYDK